MRYLWGNSRERSIDDLGAYRGGHDNSEGELCGDLGETSGKLREVFGA
jgi:hypothetical protein